MAKARAIVKRLKAIRNIRKITRTMELIATARFKRAMDRATEAAAYTHKISEIVSDLSRANLEFSHPLLEEHAQQQNGILLVLTSNRGLCGAYNSSVLRQTTGRLKKLGESEQTVSLEVSGKRGIGFLTFQGYEFERRYTHFEDKPSFGEVEELADRYIELYVNGEIDWLDVAYMKFQSASRQEPVIDPLLPIGQMEEAPEPAEEQWTDYEFLPSAESILEEIVPASFKARLFKCFLDAAVSEQIYRMVAMKAATENAGEMIDTLQMQYNRARQAQITSELSEIIGGAAALE